MGGWQAEETGAVSVALALVGTGQPTLEQPTLARSVTLPGSFREPQGCCFELQHLARVAHSDNPPGSFWFSVDLAGGGGSRVVGGGLSPVRPYPA